MTDRDAPDPNGLPDPDEPDPLAQAYALALQLEKAGRRIEAAEAWRQVLSLDPEDHGGAEVRLAALGVTPAPTAASPAYVRTLFDQHAETFEEILVDSLGYAVPERLTELLRATLQARGPVSVLDLGCGTGLATAALGDLAARATGVDLSEAMLAEADAREIYDELYVGDVVEFLKARDVEDDGDAEGPWDLVVAADLLPYIGDLEPLIEGAFRNLAPRGLLALSAETLPDDAFDSLGWRVGPHQRFHHSAEYLSRVMFQAGLSVSKLEPMTIRYNEGQPEPGFAIIAERP